MSSDEHLVSGHFVYDDRPRHDVFWGLLYAGALALTTVGGIYSASHRYATYLHACTTAQRFHQVLLRVHVPFSALRLRNMVVGHAAEIAASRYSPAMRV